MIWAIIILILAILAYALILGIADEDNRFLIMIGGCFKLAIISAIVVLIEIKHPSPTALDVYRGKTTLEITYRDSVALDSIVVYKMK